MQVEGPLYEVIFVWARGKEEGGSDGTRPGPEKREVSEPAPSGEPFARADEAAGTGTRVFRALVAGVSGATGRESGRDCTETQGAGKAGDNALLV